MSKIRKMSIREFRETGFLQEINRLFLHPLGLALEVEIDGDGNERLGGIWDYRDDPDGIAFTPSSICPHKIRAVEALRQSKAGERVKLYGSHIQPAGDQK